MLAALRPFLVLWSGMPLAFAFKASVVEMVPVVWEQAHIASCAEVRVITDQNVQSMTRFIAAAAGNGSEMIVFPEYGLQGPNLASYEAAFPWLYNLTTTSVQGVCGDAVTALSQAAAKYQVDVVLNVGEVAWNATGGHRQYNAQVVLSGLNGSVVAKYRKSHLYYEPAFDPNPNPVPITFRSFKTHTMVGLLICFDIMHATPTLALVNVVGLHGIAFSTWWPNYPPLLTGTQVQSGFVRRFPTISFFAAGVGCLGWQLSGSGIYSHNRKSVALVQFNQTGSVMLSLDTSHAGGTYVNVVNPADSRQLVLPPTATTRLALPKPPPTPMTVLGGTSAPFEVNVSVFAPADIRTATILRAATTNVSCRMLLEPRESPTSKNKSVEAKAEWADSTRAPNFPFALVAASGVYNGLFPAVFCALIPCHSADSSCFEDKTYAPFAPNLTSLHFVVNMDHHSSSIAASATPTTASTSNAVATNAAAAATISNASRFTYFPQGAAADLVALLDQQVTTPNATAVALNHSSVTTLALVGVAMHAE